MSENTGENEGKSRRYAFYFSRAPGRRFPIFAFSQDVAKSKGENKIRNKGQKKCLYYLFRAAL